MSTGAPMSGEATGSPAVLFRLLSRLLDYPDADLHAHLPELLDLTAEAEGMAAAECEALGTFIAWAREQRPTELQGAWVQTFDMMPEHSLHLTHHTLGDSRERGPALIELDEHYRGNGLQTNDKRELPDYLPLVLEYVSTLDGMQARWFLAQMKGVLQLLADNLAKVRSPWGPLVEMVAERARLVPVPEADSEPKVADTDTATSLRSGTSP